MKPYDNLQKVIDFHSIFGHPVAKEVDLDTTKLRLALIREELKEVEEEVAPLFYGDIIDKSKLTKEIADLLYVTYGFAVAFGLPINQVFNAVHLSNLSKLGKDGKPIYREDGKILKGPNYKEAEVDRFFK